MPPWFTEELAPAALEDKRLNERFEEILEALGKSPHASIPAAFGGRAKLKAAYRFCDNDKVTPQKILQPHHHATTKRCQQQKIVLCAQESSALDFTRPQQQVEGAGPLACSRRLGAFLHLNEAFTEEGTPLGAIDAKLWAREEPDPDAPKLSQVEKEKKRLALPIEEKESFRWLEGIRAVQQLARDCPETTCISLSDSEGDIYELFAEPKPMDNFHWIVRACHNRVVLNKQGAPVSALRDSLLEQAVLFTNEITVRSRPSLIPKDERPRSKTRSGRRATVEVRAALVTLKSPTTKRQAIRAVTVHAVWVRESEPPTGEVPIEWILLTTLPISTVEKVATIIRY